MQFSTLLVFHSYFRWIVLTAMFLQFIWLYINQKNNSLFSPKQYYLLLFFTLIYDIQLVLGFLLYSESILVQSFWNDISLGIKNRQIRFFGLEHVFMMTLGVFLVNLYTIITFKSINQKDIFRYLWKRYLWIFFIILSSIPWSFSPLTSRPNFR